VTVQKQPEFGRAQLMLFGAAVIVLLVVVWILVG
jgi:type II secretory pathway component PulM